VPPLPPFSWIEFVLPVPPAAPETVPELLPWWAVTVTESPAKTVFVPVPPLPIVNV
jgi:hypothetical protein